MHPKPPIFLISGPPGAGKSSVARALLERFEFGIHLPLDDLREFVVSGIAHPVPTLTPEFGRQYCLSLEAGILLAQLYARNGFAVAIDNVVSVDDARVFDTAFQNQPFHKILLLPRLETALERNRTRRNKSFDTSVLKGVIQRIHAEYGGQVLGADWTVLDTSELSLEQTVKKILESRTVVS